MQIIIEKATGREFKGTVIDSVQKLENGLKYWLFETEIGREFHIWECHSDYWDLISNDMRKVVKALDIEEKKDKGMLEIVKSILRFGHCK